MKETLERLHLALPAQETGRDAALYVQPGDLRVVAERLLCLDYFLEDVCGLDLAEGPALLYHFAHWVRRGRVVLRVMLDRADPVCPSIEGIYPGAAWHEREARDFFGITFQGAADDQPLLLAEHMDPPPLLKDPGARMPRERLWHHGEWVGPARGSGLADELQNACAEDPE